MCDGLRLREDCNSAACICVTLENGLGKCRVISKKESGIKCLLFAMTIAMARFPQKKMDDIS